MSTPIVVHGVVTADGTLQIAERLSLTPGPVEITIQPVPQAATPQEDWWQYLQRARAEVERKGGAFRSQEDIESEREAFRSEDGE